MRPSGGDEERARWAPRTHGRASFGMAAGRAADRAVTILEASTREEGASDVHQTVLTEKIDTRQAVVGVCGLGYVGLPLLLTFAEHSFPVVGFDIDPGKVAALTRGQSYLRHIDSARVGAQLAKGDHGFGATGDFRRARDADALLLCVPTPLTPAREPDMTYIESTARSIAPHLRPGQLVVLESSTYPGTTEEVVKPILESVSGLRAGEDFFLAFSPEREDPGNPHFNTANIPKVVGGFTPRCTAVASALYAAAITRVVQVKGTREAELTKLLENIFRCVNIALVNELKLLCERMGIDIFEVISAAATKPFGFMPFYPGPGLGGHCIPIDPFYLTWKAREFEFQTRFIELAGEINTSMPYHVVRRTMDALNSEGKTLKGARILVLGLAYKKNVDDLRESPSIRIIELLRERGAEVEYHDPFCPRITAMRHKPAYLLEMESVELEQGLARADAVVIVTDHDAVDYTKVVCGAKLVIDTRNATRAVLVGREKIWTA